MIGAELQPDRATSKPHDERHAADEQYGFERQIGHGVVDAGEIAQQQMSGDAES